jgi:dipeptidyl aminopeptidase/acylaminoacyl peptidase
MPLLSAAVLLLAAADAPAAPRQPLVPEDVGRILELKDPQLSPDGSWIAYVVEGADLATDKATSDIWMTSWDGTRQVRLTSSAAQDTHPRFSPDGRLLAFLSDRGKEDDELAQVWVLDLLGGEPRVLTDAKGGIEAFDWSPDGKRLAVIVNDPDPKAKDDAKDDDDDKPEPPIVVDRYLMKRDYEGYLGAERARLGIFEIASRSLEILTKGAFDDASPAFSPDGRHIAFASKRGGDPDRHWNADLWLVEAKAGAEARALTTFEGGDAKPDWDSPPRFSRDGAAIAYLRHAGASVLDEMYGGPELALQPVTGGEPRRLTAALDRHVRHPRWSPDGRWLYFVLEDDRRVQLARVPAAGGPVERLTSGDQVVSALDVGRDGRIAVVASRSQAPTELFALESGALRPLTRHNEAWLATKELGSVVDADFTSADGTRVGALVVRPPDFAPGRRYPTIAWIHGGPVGQDQHDLDSGDSLIAQYLAGRGYLVVRPNYRGSSGRGFAFSKAIAADWGRLEVQDVLAAVDGLVAQGVADPQRLGIGGWSYGAMTTNYTIASDPRFKAAVSIAGISNMLSGYGVDHYVQQYENELGPPWKALDQYVKLSYPFLKADRITTPALFMCGQEDWNVPLVNSEQMYQALKSLGRDTRLVIYPGAHHGIDAPSHRKDLLERLADWYGKRIGNSPVSPAR